MAIMTIKYESGRRKASSKDIDSFIRDTMRGLHKMRKDVEDKNMRLSCSLPGSLFTKKSDAGRK